MTRRFDLDRTCSRFSMLMTWQSSHLRVGLPLACVLSATFGFAPPSHGQEQFRTQVTENFRRDSSTTSPVLASVMANATVAGEAIGGRWLRITLDGWIWAASTTPASRDGFHLRVSQGGGENLRDGPQGPIVAKLEEGCLLMELERQGDWIHVRRSGWMWGQSLVLLGATPPGSGSGAIAQPVAPDLDRAVVADPSALRSVPDGDTTATLRAETPVRVLARLGDWVRVQTEGWMREDELRTGTPGVLVGVSGGEVRSRPDEFVNRVVQWTLQFIALQRADEARYDIPVGQRYLLTRGPLPETGFVYVTITDEHVEQFEQMEPLTQLVLVGRVRTGRSRYLGNPVLQLLDYTIRQD